MVVKGVAVDAALLLISRTLILFRGLFVEQLQKRRFNGLLGKICHTYLRLFCTYSLGKLIIAFFPRLTTLPKRSKWGHTIPTVMTDGSQGGPCHAKEKPFRDPAPDIHDFPGVPESTFDLVNQYGTYNIQPTSHTENLFPLIGPELPERWRTMRLGKRRSGGLVAEVCGADASGGRFAPAPRCAFLQAVSKYGRMDVYHMV